MDRRRFAQKLRTPKALANSSPGWVSNLGFSCVGHSTLKAFANSTELVDLRFIASPGLRQPWAEICELRWSFSLKKLPVPSFVPCDRRSLTLAREEACLRMASPAQQPKRAAVSRVCSPLRCKCRASLSPHRASVLTVPCKALTVVPKIESKIVAGGDMHYRLVTPTKITAASAITIRCVCLFVFRKKQSTAEPEKPAAPTPRASQTPEQKPATEAPKWVANSVFSR